MPRGIGAAEQAGAVQEIRGEAYVQANEGRKALQKEAAVYVADTVGTGNESRLTLRLGRDTTVRMGEKTLLTVDRFVIDAGGELTLQSGPILVDQPPGRSKQRTQIRTPFGLIAVRGTRFFAGPSRKGETDVFGVFVERGRVIVSAHGRQVTLRKGQGTDLFVGRVPTQPARWGAERVRVALDTVR